MAGFIYVAFVVDVFSRRILGWRVTTTKHTSMVTDALRQALQVRRRGEDDSFQHEDQVEIVGTAGALQFSCFAEEPLRLRTGRVVEQIKAPYPNTVQLPLIQTVVNALTGHGESPSTGHSALRTARVIDVLLSDYRESRRQMGR